MEHSVSMRIMFSMNLHNTESFLTHNVKAWITTFLSPGFPEDGTSVWTILSLGPNLALKCCQIEMPI